MQEVLNKIGLKQVERKEKLTPAVIVKIIGDVNDGDYSTAETKFNLTGSYAEENIDELTKIVEIFREHRTTILSNYVADKYLNEDCNESEQVKRFFNIEILDFPSLDDYYCHTVESVEFIYEDENGTIVELELI